MDLLTAIEVDNPDHISVKIPKLFQVVFVHATDHSTSVSTDVYTAVVYSSTESDRKRSSTIRVSTTLNNTIASKTLDKSSVFFRDIEVIRQFWGEESTLIDKSEFAFEWMQKRNQVLTEAQRDELKSRLNESLSNAVPCLGIHQIDKEIGPLVVIPRPIVAPESHTMAAVPIRPTVTSEQGSTGLIADGIWIHESFAETERLPDGVLSLKHRLMASGFTSEDVRVYYSFPSGSEVRSQSGTIKCFGARADTKATEEYEIEVHRVYSQEMRRYFEEWEVHTNLKNSTLLRIEPSARFESSFSAGKVDECTVRVRMILERVRERQHMVVLLGGIWLGAALGVGLDKTRLIMTQEHFPTFGYVDGGFVWLLMCLLVMPLFVPGLISQRDKSSRVLLTTSLVFFVCWSTLSFFVGPKISRVLPSYTYQLTGLAQIVTGVVGLALSKYVRQFGRKIVRKYKDK